MANVTVNGVPYTGVEEVYLPKTGGGEERFTLPPSGTVPINSNGTVDVAAYQYANVSVPTGADTSDATATASDIVGGKTAYIASGKTTGTMTSKSAQTYTPGTSDQTINAGQYLAGAQTIKGDANLIESNIKSGVSIFGKTGTYSGGGTSVLINTGSFTAAGDSYLTVNCTDDTTHMPFVPDVVFIYPRNVTLPNGINHLYKEGGFIIPNPLSFDLKSIGQSPYTISVSYAGDIDVDYVMYGGYALTSANGFSVGAMYWQSLSGAFEYISGITYDYKAIKYTT